MKETNYHILKALKHNGKVDTLLLEPRPGLDAAIVGTRLRKATGLLHLVYDVDLLARAFMAADGMDAEEAYEWISYNTERALPYAAGPDVAEPVLRHRRN